jgi:hypothetical protein
VRSPDILASELTPAQLELVLFCLWADPVDAQCSDAPLRFLDAELEVYVSLLPEFFPPVEEEVHDKPER